MNGITGGVRDAQAQNAAHAQAFVQHRRRIFGDAHAGRCRRDGRWWCRSAARRPSSSASDRTPGAGPVLLQARYFAVAPASTQCAAPPAARRPPPARPQAWSARSAGFPAWLRASSAVRRMLPRRVGRRLHTLAVKAERRAACRRTCRASSGWMWNCRFGVACSGEERVKAPSRDGAMVSGPRRNRAYCKRHLRLAQHRAVILVERADALDAIDGPQLEMVLEVLADARRVVEDLDPEAAQAFRIADAGELEEMRRADGARAQHHLPAGHDAPAIARPASIRHRRPCCLRRSAARRERSSRA